MGNFLALKVGDSHFKEKDGQFAPCGLDKASVYPETDFESLLIKYRLLKNVYADLQIVRLVVTEEPFYKE